MITNDIKIDKLLQPYLPAGGYSMTDVYGTAITALLKEAAERVVRARAEYPHIKKWKLQVPLESYGIEGNLFKFIRETYKYVMIKDFGNPTSTGVRGYAYPDGSEMALAKAKYFNVESLQDDAERLKGWLMQALERRWNAEMLSEDDAPAFLLADRTSANNCCITAQHQL